MLLSFSTFLREQQQIAEIGNDSRGKLHELLFAKHLHPEKKLPEHFRNKHGSSPKEVHDFIKDLHPEHYGKIEHHSKLAADATLHHLHSTGMIPKDHKIDKVSWTSNRDTHGTAGDHEKLTGVKDIHSNADVFISHSHPKTGKKGHIGISLKYGANQPETLKSPGTKDLHRITGDHTIADTYNEGQHRIRKILGDSSALGAKARFKTLSKARDPIKKATAEKAAEHARKVNSHIAKKVADGLARHSQKDLVAHLKHLTASHDNVHPHIRVVTHPETGAVKIKKPGEDFDRMTRRYKHFRVRPHNGKSTTATIEGVHHDGRSEPAVTISFKNRSSPSSSLQPMVRAPGMNRKDD